MTGSAPSLSAETRSAPTLTRRRRRPWRWMGGAALIVALLLAVSRLVLPSYLQSYVNRVLDQSPQYDGRIGTVEVSLWRGAYTIHDLKIVKTTYSVPVPFIEARRVHFSLDWRALMHGGARGKIVLEDARLNFVAGPSEEETQTGVEEPWLSIIDQLFPFRIDRAEVNNGEIHFHAFHTEPKVDVYLSNVNATIENLTNVEDKLDPLIATARARGMAMESGRFEFDMSFDPNSYRPSLNLAARLLDLDVTQLNDLSLAYGDFDFESGRFDLVVELSTKDGFVEGYAKPLFRNLKVIGARDFETKDPFQLFWEALVGVIGEVFKNQARDQFGTRITIQGEFDNPRTNLLEIVGNVLRNAFVRAYLPQVEGRVAPDATRLEMLKESE